MRLSSVRIGDMDRARDLRARRTEAKGCGVAGKVVLVLGIIVALLLAATVAFFALARSGAFEIKQVSVTGVEHLTSADVSALVSVPAGASLLDVDADGIRNRLLKDAWIQDVAVNRIFPDTLEIVVTERTITAVVEVPSGASQRVRDWAISSDGVWLMPIPDRDSEAGQATSDQVYADAEAALHIVDVPYGTTPEIGAVCTDENVNNALAIVSGMTTELAGQVTVVSATDPESTTLTLSNGVEIAFGAATDIREKERVCLELMREHEGAISYINVRVVERPTWRAL